MNRRGFLGSIFALGVAPAVVRAESLMRIVLPTTEEVIAVVGGNRLITFEMIVKEALLLLKDNLTLSQSINTEFAPTAGDVLRVMLPERYRMAA